MTAKVYLNYQIGTKWTYVTTRYTYYLSTAKSPSGIPEWKIMHAIESVEKTENYNFGEMEGDY